MNRICSRAQKGYNNSRYTQEVLINVWETIKKCRTDNVNAAVMAVDMAKAFDTLSNNFLDEVFQLFGFGPSISDSDRQFRIRTVNNKMVNPIRYEPHRLYSTG